MPPWPPLPALSSDIGGPQDEVSAATWRWAHRTVPDYLMAHSVRAYCWGAAIAAREGWTFDRQILWNASLIDFPRGAFDRRFLAAITREAVTRPSCQSARLLQRTGLARWMARSPWAIDR